MITNQDRFIQTVVCYTGSILSSHLWRGELCDDSKNGHVGDFTERERCGLENWSSIASKGIPDCKPVKPRGGTLDFKWRGWSNGAKSQDPKKPVGLPAKPKKIPGPKINPVNLIFQTHKSQAKEIKSSLKEKGIPVTVKPTDWIEAVEVLYTGGHYGTMQTIV